MIGDSVRKSISFVLLFLVVLCCGLPVGRSYAAEQARDLTFFLVSDIHVGMSWQECSREDYYKYVATNLDRIASIPDESWPGSGPVAEAVKGLGPMPEPMGLIVAGDLSEEQSVESWATFDRLFPWQPLKWPKRFPAYAGAGNH
ncbi:MAG: hypothetical protein WCK89_23790, partial [bacterium]